MVRLCPHCGCSDIDEDVGRGDATCMGCGTVIEESIVVSDNQFQERAGGSGHTLVGQTISMDRAHVTPQGVPGLSSQESREVTYARGRKLIEEVASQLRINKHCVDTAFNFFKMCVTRNLTRGRYRSHVVAACLYMTCRLENTSHLLLDFSDVTQVNVYDLGRTLNFLSRSLRINLPTTDPCLYILRFAVLLDFGEKQKEVVTLATRLVQRMKRDWLATGRRPTGLCGAALLLAARSFNFNRSVSDVVRVVHVSEAVVRKRLDEFSQTPSSALTLDQFGSLDLEHCEDPPAFREARRKAAIEREEEEAERMERDMAPVQEEVERALEKKQRDKFKRSPYAAMIGGTIEGSDLGKAEESLIREEIIDTVFREVDVKPVKDPYNERLVGPSLESLGILPGAVAPPPCVLYTLPSQDGEHGELDLSGIDDGEIDSYILTEKESEVKEKFWMKCNGEHLEEVARKKRLRDEDEAKDREDGKKKIKRKIRKKEPIQASTPAEAIEKIIQEKKLSNKINYDILKEFSGVDELRCVKKEEDRKKMLCVKKEERDISPFISSTDVVPQPTVSTVNTVTPPTTSSIPSTSNGMKRRRPTMKPLIPPSAAMKQLSMALDLNSVKGEVQSPQKKRKMSSSGSSSTPTSSTPPVVPSTEKELNVIESDKEVKPPTGGSTLLRGKKKHGPIIKMNTVSTESIKNVEKKVIDNGNSSSDKDIPSCTPSTSTTIESSPVTQLPNEDSSSQNDSVSTPIEESSKVEGNDECKNNSRVGNGLLRRSRIKPVIPQDCLWRSTRNKK